MVAVVVVVPVTTTEQVGLPANFPAATAMMAVRVVPILMVLAAAAVLYMQGLTPTLGWTRAVMAVMERKAPLRAQRRTTRVVAQVAPKAPPLPEGLEVEAMQRAGLLAKMATPILAVVLGAGTLLAMGEAAL
jgi:hypothetical protein